MERCSFQILGHLPRYGRSGETDEAVVTQLHQSEEANLFDGHTIKLVCDRRELTGDVNDRVVSVAQLQ